MDLGKTRKLTAEETQEFYEIKTPTLEQLVVLAHKCGLATEVRHNTTGEGWVVLPKMGDMIWNPREVLGQNQLLLSAVITEGDCRLFRDQELNEFFIYQYTTGKHDGPPLSHQFTLADTVFEAALTLWGSEEE